METDVIARWNALDRRDPLPSINDLCRAIGIEPQHTKPGDRFAADTELVLYWPRTSTPDNCVRTRDEGTS